MVLEDGTTIERSRVTHAVVAAGHRSAAQSSPSRVDWVLRVLCTLGVVSLAAVCQSDARTLVETQVQALSTSHDPCQSVPSTAGCAVPESVRSLEHGYYRLVCLMGAE